MNGWCSYQFERVHLDMVLKIIMVKDNKMSNIGKSQKYTFHILYNSIIICIVYNHCNMNVI